MGSGQVRVVIVDDHPIVRDGVRADLERSGRIAVVGEAGDAEQALACVTEVRPDVILLDLRLTGNSNRRALDLTRRIAILLPRTRVLVFTQAGPHDALPALRAGAHGYLPKSATAAELIDAVLTIGDGPVLPASLAAQIFGEFQSTRPDHLTPRQSEVLSYLARGYDNRDISEALGISIRTVNRHLEDIRDKVGHRRRSELMQLARDDAADE
jgi:DNA-binding NarL/FixJ family response regulator